MRSSVVALITLVSLEIHAAPAREDPSSREVRARTEVIVRTIAVPDVETQDEVEGRLGAVVRRSPRLAARYPFRWWRLTSLKRARQLADEFAQAEHDLEKLPGESARLARGRALEALVELAGLAGANLGAPPDHMTELRPLPFAMLGALSYSTFMHPGPSGVIFTAVMGGAYGLFEGLRSARLHDARIRDDQPWGRSATAVKIYEEFGQRLEELRPGAYLAVPAGEVALQAFERLRADAPEMLEVCDVLLARTRTK